MTALPDRKPTLFALAFLAFAAPASAGVYSAADPFPFITDDVGLVRPLVLTNFKLLMNEWLSVPAPTGAALRESLETQVRELGKKDPSQLTPDEFATRSAALIRLRKLDDAFNMLISARRMPREYGFFVHTHLAHLHYLRGEYREAYENQSSALTDYPAPTKFGNLKQNQIAWLLKVEKECILPLYRYRRDEAKLSGTQVADLPDALFPSRNPRDKEAAKPVDWKYGADGKIAADEAAKLPVDAIPRIQLMLLNNPADTRLYWLLGELFSARGESDPALRIFDECVDTPRNYTTALLMEHRQFLRRMIETKAEEAKAEEAKKTEEGKAVTRWILAGCGVALALFFGFQIRSVVRRLRR